MKNQLAIVTGASSGIGMDIAKILARHGFNLVITARRLSRLQELANFLKTVRCFPFVCDLSRAGSGKELFEQARAIAQENNLTLTILVNNAGAGVWNGFIDNEIERELVNIDLNIRAVTELTHYCIQEMARHGQQSYVLNVSSLAAYLATPNYAVYSASKAYLRFFTEILSSELSKSKISFSCVCPGGTRTEFVALAGQQLKAASEIGMMNSDVVAEIAVNGMFKKKLIIIPGFLNKLTLFFFSHLPRKWQMGLLYKTMSRGIENKNAKKFQF